MELRKINIQDAFAQWQYTAVLTEALRTGSGHIGYSIGAAFRGRGYGTKGLALLLPIARSIVPEEEIYLRVMKNNPASAQVMRSNGAYPAGEDADHFFMRLPK